MKQGALKFFIHFIGIYFVLVIQYLADKAPTRKYLIGIIIALVATLLFELIEIRIQKFIRKRKERIGG